MVDLQPTPLAQCINSLSGEQAKEALEALLKSYLEPAFGALPKREIDLLFFSMLKKTGYVGAESSLYSIMSDLKVTRGKARSLLYDTNVRAVTKSELNELLREDLSKAGFSKDGNYFVIEIENPLLQAHLRDLVRRLGHVTDTSFNQSLVRMSFEAVGELAEAILGSDRQHLRKALVKAGAADGSLKGIIAGALKQLGKRVAGEAGDRFAEGVVIEVGSFLKPLFQTASDLVTERWAIVFKEEGS